MSEEKKKGFIEVLKSKPQTLAEAKKKTKYFFILVGAIGLVFSVLAALLHIFFGIIMLVGCAGIFGFLYFKENQKNKRNFCPDCGARIDYENGVEWEVTKYDEKDYTPKADVKGRQVTAKRIATVEFTCTCTECGAVKTFTQQYDAIVWYDDGTHKKNNIEAMAKNYFKI